MDFGLVASLSSWLDAGWWWSIFQVVFGLGAVIFVHELGHFLAAKFCGVKAEKFYLGFDAFDIKIGDRVIIPRRLVHWQWGETEYGVGILPLGGYVKMLGQDDNPSKMAEERERAMLTEGDGVDGTALDPRSYMAKSVPQRMLIISAGVIMNLIFAVIFATLAFRSGVMYEPAAVGSTIPGSPAWQNNLDGASIQEINGLRTDDPDRYFTFNHLKEAIILDSKSGPLNLEFRRPDSEATETASIMAAGNLIDVKGGRDLRSLGIAPMLSNTLGDPPTISGQAAEQAEPPLQAGDTVVDVEGTPVTNGYEMRRAFARIPDQTAQIRVLRKSADGNSEETVEITLPPNPYKNIGVEMELGPVRALRKDSPAARAGMEPFDRIIAIDGDAPGNPFTLQQRMLKLARNGESVEITYLRASESASRDDGMEELTATVQPELPLVPPSSDPRFGITVESLGLNLSVSSVVARADDASPLQQGDEVINVTFQLTPEQAKDEQFDGMETAYDLTDEDMSWAAVDRTMQFLAPGTKLELKYVRNRQTATAELTLQEVEGAFRETRGIWPTFDQQSYQNDSLWVAAGNGFRQTVDDASRVLKFLRKLVTGELKVTALGGPGTIAAVATSEASRGTSRLLLFLTLLSANLAIVNFLPIPVLDGGHMVFLAYEGIFRRPVNERLQIALSIAGFVFLVTLMVTVIGLDIWRFT